MHAATSAALLSVRGEATGIVTDSTRSPMWSSLQGTRTCYTADPNTSPSSGSLEGLSRPPGAAQSELRGDTVCAPTE